MLDQACETNPAGRTAQGPDAETVSYTCDSQGPRLLSVPLSSTGRCGLLFGPCLSCWSHVVLYDVAGSPLQGHLHVPAPEPCLCRISLAGVWCLWVGLHNLDATLFGQRVGSCCTSFHMLTTVLQVGPHPPGGCADLPAPADGQDAQGGGCSPDGQPDRLLRHVAHAGGVEAHQ